MLGLAVHHATINKSFYVILRVTHTCFVNSHLTLGWSVPSTRQASNNTHNSVIVCSQPEFTSCRDRDQVRC